jgi:putative hydrolase of the HAD superfamily
VLLDLDETLIDGATLISSTVATSAAFAAQHPELELDPGALARANAAAWSRSWAEFERQWIRGELDDLTLSTIVWRRALGDLGVADPERFAARVAHDHNIALTAAIRPFDDALPALDALHRAGIPLGIVTNGSSSAQRAKVEILGPERFSFVGVSGEIGIAKPDPRLFEIALAAFDLPPSDVVHVGDNLVADIAGAAAAGLDTVWINRTGAVPPPSARIPDAEITSLAQLTSALGLTTA